MPDVALLSHRPKTGKDSKYLSFSEQLQAAARAVPGALVIHKVLRKKGETELRRSTGALFWSGLGGGLSMGFSLLTPGFLRACLPYEP